MFYNVGLFFLFHLLCAVQVLFFFLIKNRILHLFSSTESESNVTNRRYRFIISVNVFITLDSSPFFYLLCGVFFFFY